MTRSDPHPTALGGTFERADQGETERERATSQRCTESSAAPACSCRTQPGPCCRSPRRCPRSRTPSAWDRTARAPGAPWPPFSSHSQRHLSLACRDKECLSTLPGEL